MELFSKILTTEGDYFLNSVNRLVFVVELQCG
jgi:hypothetical protein